MSVDYRWNDTDEMTSFVCLAFGTVFVTTPQIYLKEIGNGDIL